METGAATGREETTAVTEGREEEVGRGVEEGPTGTPAAEEGAAIAREEAAAAAGEITLTAGEIGAGTKGTREREGLEGE